MKYDLFNKKDNKYMGFANNKMIKNFTEKQIIEFYAEMNIKVEGLNFVNKAKW